MTAVIKTGEVVCEFQGLYGPFTLSERVLQKIWLRGDFHSRGLRTESGRVIEITHPGKWNLQEGPDFKDARIRLDGTEIVGDIEVHFSQRDWWQHSHAESKRFNRVILHVVLHPPARNERAARTQNGRVPEVLILLPRLNRDLESYAADEALLEMEQVNELEWVATFLQMPLQERRQRLLEQAGKRWGQKLAYAGKRLGAATWSEACHQMCLEVLGYRRNRETMGRIATRFPLSRMQKDFPEAEALYHTESGNWKLAGLRPSNHPRRRIREYLGIVRMNPSWPEALQTQFRIRLAQVPSFTATREARRSLGLSDLRRTLADSVLAGRIGPQRLNTLVCDAFLPLAAASGLTGAADAWLHWYPGDTPDAMRRFLKHSGVTGGRSHAHSNGWNQGALGLFLERGG